MPDNLELEVTKEDAALPEEASPPRRRRMFLIVPVLLLVGIGIWFWRSRSGETLPQEGESRIKATLHLETFVLNLADTDQKSYLRVGIDLGLSQEGKRGEDLATVAQVRDSILAVLAQARVDELLTPDGKTKLKASLLRALQERVPQLGVEEVYFTEFLIQR